MKKEKFKKITRVSLPFDRRHEDDSKNYGVHGLDVYFVLIGPKGATQFAATFSVYLPHVQKEFDAKGVNMGDQIMGTDVGYHSPHPQYEGQTCRDCDYLEGAACYYDGSGLRGSQWAKEIFAIRGRHLEDEIWKRLEKEYEEIFENKAAPGYR